MTKPTQAQIEAVRGAVARGWCRAENSHKEMDSDLAEAITQEVLGLTAAAEVGERLIGARPIPIERDALGRIVREAWIRWAQTQDNPKPSWLVTYDELSEPDKEADRQIGETVARFVLIFDAATAAVEVGNWEQSADGKETIRESSAVVDTLISIRARATIERCAQKIEMCGMADVVTLQDIAAAIRKLKDEA